MISWTFERAVTVLDSFPSNRFVEAIASAVRVRRALKSQDLALSISLRNKETAVNRPALLCQLKSTNGHAMCANGGFLLILAKPLRTLDPGLHDLPGFFIGGGPG